MNRIFTMKSSLPSFCSHLAAMLLFCLSALSATAQSVTQNHIKYTITNSTQTAAAVGTDDKYIQHVVIADSVAYNGELYPVVAINSKAFQSCSNLRSVTLGSSLKKIGSYAFSNCEFLTEVRVPEGVETIESNAFLNCSVRYADLPSTLRTLGSGVFKTNFPTQLDTLVLRTAYYDEAGQMRVLPFSTSCFNNAIKKSCVLMVPKKAYDYYVFPTVDNSETGASNWGSFFTQIVAFGTAPSGCTVVPQEALKDFRDLSNVEVTFNFDDEKLQNLLSFGPDDYINASLLLPGGKSLRADSVALRGNSICLDFAEVLLKNRELFIASTEEDAAIDVQLILDGQIQLEECPYMLGSFFAHHPIAWSVPLLPSVYDLPTPPAVEPRGEAADGRYDYKAFETLTLKFDGYTDLSLDTATGAYIAARLYKDGELLALAQSAEVCDSNALTLSFDIPTAPLLVRRTSGIESYDFTLEVEGQVNMNGGGEAQNFRFTIPALSADSPAFWQVLPLYIPEPTGVTFLPASQRIKLDSLTDVALTFEGVTTVALATQAATHAATAEELHPLKACLFMNGEEITSIGADKVRVAGSTLHLLFDPIDERLVTLISSDTSASYPFTMSLEADLLTDGYPCRVVIGEEASVPADGVGVAKPYTQYWTNPCWDVEAHVYDVPEVTASVPAAEEVTDYEQLRVVELTIDNYKHVMPLSVGGGQFASARLLRYGNPVCVTSNIKTEGNRIIIDFDDKLTYNAVGITPDDAPDQLVDLTLYFEADLLIDGLPYHLVYDGYKHDLLWSLKPVVVYKLPTPTIEHEQNRIFFTSGVEGVEYHYTIANADATPATTTTANKTNGGSSLRIPLQRRYSVTVYTTREGYDDSDTAAATLNLDTTPIVELEK